MQSIIYELCSDHRMNRLINDCCKKRIPNVIEYILGKYSEFCEFQEILADFANAKQASLKSLQEAQELIDRAYKVMEKKNYAEALVILNRSLQALPHSYKNFLNDIKEIISARTVCFEKLNRREEVYRNQSLLAGLNYAQMSFKKPKSFVKKSVKKRDDFISQALEPCFYRNAHERQYKVGLRTNQFIPKNTLLISEKPAVIVRALNLNRCLNCDARIGDAYFPCFFCRDVRFCNIACAEEAFKFHKFECGYLKAFYKHKLIIHLHMLRFYSKTEQNPLIEFDPSKNYLFNLQSNFGKCKNEDLLNAMRHSLTQTEKPKNVYFRPKLFGNIFRAILFHKVYLLCLKRGEFINGYRKKNRINLQRFDPEIDDTEKIVTILDAFKNLDQITLCERIYADVCRWDECAFLYGSSYPWAEDEKDSIGVSCSPILCSGIAAVSSFYFADTLIENGQLVVKSCRDIVEGSVITIISEHPRSKHPGMYKVIQLLRDDARENDRSEVDASEL